MNDDKYKLCNDTFKDIIYTCSYTLSGISLICLSYILIQSIIKTKKPSFIVEYLNLIYSLSTFYLRNHIRQIALINILPYYGPILLMFSVVAENHFFTTSFLLIDVVLPLSSREC